ncbi:hypothetical protein CDL12_01487 [Handroanthus impetiginosus]|uniref:Uncharacterized protein n=1 Tax=Handroanthus impetiginosus TaxID=429701 RepID=A0A2G9I7N9_9LAMI|nr:hypothetical protein CDL12_01487 [Handroanthus impetiginosus]
MIKTLEYFEEKMTLLYRDEMDLENRYGEIETTFANNVGFYVTMLGVGSVFGSVFVSDRRTVFFIFGTLLVNFIVGVG